MLIGGILLAAVGWLVIDVIYIYFFHLQPVFPLLYDEQGGPSHCFSKPPRTEYATIATS